MKKFEKPSLEVTEIEVPDVIMASGETCNDDYGGGEF
jgi:hypothetical protein